MTSNLNRRIYKANFCWIYFETHFFPLIATDGAILVEYILERKKKTI